MPRRAVAAALTLIVLPGLLGGTGAGWSIARLTASSSVAGNSFTTAASFDTVAPTVSASVLSKVGDYIAGYVHQGGAYYVYANATDAGVVPSGIATITADVSNFTLPGTAVPLVAGSYGVEGVAYGYRSASTIAVNPLSAGSKSYSLTSTDNSGNARTQTGYAAMVDNTSPTGTDVQCVDGGGTIGLVESGDRCTFTFSEIIDSESILSGWTGASTSVVLRWTDNATNDTFTVWNAANTALLALGTVNTRGDYVSGAVTVGATGTPCTMVLDTVANTITITLGTISGTVKRDGKKNTSQWTPSASAFDRAGNAMSATAVNEGGNSDQDF